MNVNTWRKEKRIQTRQLTRFPGNREGEGRRMCACTHIHARALTHTHIYAYAHSTINKIACMV